MAAIGLIMPILPKLIESLVDDDTASAARILGLFGTASALFACLPASPDSLFVSFAFFLSCTCILLLIVSSCV